MEKKQTSLYEKLVYVAYGYYILLGVCWFFLRLFYFGVFDFWAVTTILIFAAQSYFRQKLTNLIIGILTLGLSVYGTLEFITVGDKRGFNVFVDAMLGVFLISLIMSGILIFSYTKLSFKDQ